MTERNMRDWNVSITKRSRSTEAIFYEYLENRSLQNALLFCAPDIVNIGAGDKNIAYGKQQVKQLFEREFARHPAPVPHDFLEWRESRVAEHLYSCYTKVRIYINESRGEDFFDARITTLVCCKKDTEQILQIHSSVPITPQEPDDFMPLHYRVKYSYKSDLQQKKKLVEILTDLIPGGMVGGYLEEGYPISFINEELLQWLGYTYDEFIEVSEGKLENIINPNDKDNVKQIIGEALQKGNVYEVNYRLRKKSGEYLWMYEKGKTFFDDMGCMAYTAVLLDVSESMVQKERLERDACYDNLTGVFNRRKAICDVEEYLQQEKSGAFCVIDIDNFKMVNDLYGHLAGDKVLCQLAKILKMYVRKTDIVARIGEDEFVLYLHNVKEDTIVKKRIDQICSAFSDYIAQRYALSDASLSIGVWYCEKQTGSFNDLYEKADALMYSVKKSGKNSILLSGNVGQTL